jgi:hypothetical protein
MEGEIGAAGAVYQRILEACSDARHSPVSGSCKPGASLEPFRKLYNGEWLVAVAAERCHHMGLRNRKWEDLSE